MQPEALLKQLDTCLEYFNRSTSCLTEEDSSFKPFDEAFTVAQQMAHVAHTFDWFADGVFGPDGFDLDFSEAEKALAKVTSLAMAREWLEGAFKNLTDEIRSRTADELAQTLPPGLVMGGAPRFAAVQGVVEHTAHHRGVLTVYSRLCGHKPASPYMD